MTVTINAASKHQLVDGFGVSDIRMLSSGASAAVADFLWRSDVGLGYSLVREQISQDNAFPQMFSAVDNTGVDTGFNSYACALQATARGARVWGNSWAFPKAWQGGSDTGTLDPAHYTDAANWIVTYLDTAWNTRGCPIFGVSFQNEPDITPSGYSQTSWTQGQSLTFLKSNLYPALQTWASANPSWQTATGLTVPQIIAINVAFWGDLASWVASYEGDATALSEISYYATHQYGGGSVSSPPSPCSRRIWQCEVYNQSQTTFDPTMTNAMVIAGYIHNALTTGNASAWIYWEPDIVNTSGQGQNIIGTDGANGASPSLSLADYNRGYAVSVGNFAKQAYVLGNWSKFVRPGWTRVDVSGAPAGVSITAFVDAMGFSVAIVCVNTNGSPTATSFLITNGPKVLSVTPWITDSIHNCTAAQSSVAVSAGAFSVTLGADSVTTFTGSIPFDPIGFATVA